MCFYWSCYTIPEGDYEIILALSLSKFTDLLLCGYSLLMFSDVRSTISTGKCFIEKDHPFAGVQVRRLGREALKPSISLVTPYAHSVFTSDLLTLRPCSIWTVQYSGLDTSAPQNSMLVNGRQQWDLQFTYP